LLILAGIYLPEKEDKELMRLGLKLTIVILLASALLSSCRTSQQTRHNSANNSRNNTASAGSGKSMDSLYILQDKLLTIIDTMADVVAQDQIRIRDLENEVAKLKSMIDQQRMLGSGTVPQMPQSQSYTAPPPAPPIQNSQPQYAPPSNQTAWPRDDKYSAALKMFNDGKYMDALMSFDELSRKEPSSQYAPNFLYWKGESLYALGQYAEAIRTFHDVLNKYPQSTKADDAEFKIGAAYEKLGDKKNARSAYQRLILSYPESEYKARAEARLNKLK
jgi:tol-pal system protein YbgF